MSLSVRSFLIEQGLLEAHQMPTSSGQFVIECVNCHHHNHKLYVSGEGKGLNCKHCGFSMGWRKFVRMYEPPTPQEEALEAFTRLAEDRLWANEPLLEYLAQRGLNEQVIRAARLGFLPEDEATVPSLVDHEVGLAANGRWRLLDRIIIPYTRDGLVETVRGRSNPNLNRDPRYLGLPGVAARLYYPQTIDHSKPVFVSEGEFDALVLTQLGYQAVGSPGANQVEAAKPLRDFSKVYLCFDGDDAGHAGAKALKGLIPEVYEVSLPHKMDVTDYVKEYGEDSFSYLVGNAKLFVEGKEQQDDRMDLAIEAWEDWAWSNGELLGPKINWAPRLEKALSGWSRGLFLVGALPNSGKSCFFVKSAYECAKDNPDDTVCVYISLDDDQEDAISRLVSLHTGVSFEVIRTPRWSFDHPTDPTRRNANLLAQFTESLKGLKSLHNLIFRDAKYGRSLQYLRLYLASIRKRFPEKRLVFFIDSLAKVTAEGEPDTVPINNWKAHLATELKYLSTLHDLCIVTPADFRKLNDERRPTNDDLKDASELAYEANAVLLGFNELNVKGDAARTILKWSDPKLGSSQFPIFELNTTKNKKSLYKGAIRFKFYPATSQFLELSEEEDAKFTEQIKEAAANNVKRTYASPSGQRFIAEPVPAEGIFDKNYTPAWGGNTSAILQPQHPQRPSYVSSPNSF